MKVFGCCVWLTVASIGCAASCGDPVHDDRIEALGPEDPDVEPGPLHRPAQPCIACHDGSLSDADRYTVAGTVFAYRDTDVAAPAIKVELIDARGKKFTAKTNCAGNFYVTPKQFDPTYPIWTSLVLGDYRVDMQSRIGRDGSCASCHAADVSQSLTDPVYLYSLMDTEVDRSECP